MKELEESEIRTKSVMFRPRQSFGNMTRRPESSWRSSSSVNIGMRDSASAIQWVVRGYGMELFP
jgi:hypothetical protein